MQKYHIDPEGVTDPRSICYENETGNKEYALLAISSTFWYFDYFHKHFENKPIYDDNPLGLVNLSLSDNESILRLNIVHHSDTKGVMRAVGDSGKYGERLLVYIDRDRRTFTKKERTVFEEAERLIVSNFSTVFTEFAGLLHHLLKHHPNLTKVGRYTRVK